MGQNWLEILEIFEPGIRKISVSYDGSFCVSIPPIMFPRTDDTQALLKQVSRSFYLSLRCLPRSIKQQMGVAYLLARASDTIADTRLVETSRRHAALLQFRETVRDACKGKTTAPPNFGDLAAAQETTTGEGTPAERNLLECFGGLLKALREFNSGDRVKIGKLLDTITRGQETDLLRFSSPDRIVALNSDEELDRYVYEVAGCVGEFWTEMCRAHLFPKARLDDNSLRTNGIRFGKGLQMVNILRDLPKDLHRGRCYIPKDRLAACGLGPGDLLDPSSMDRFRPLYEGYLHQAEAHLFAGRQYTTALPVQAIRIRLACSWPILIGLKTLGKLRLSNVLDDRSRIKISHGEIRRVMFLSAVLYVYPASWNRLFDTAGSRIEDSTFPKDN